MIKSNGSGEAILESECAGAGTCATFPAEIENVDSQSLHLPRFPRAVSANFAGLPHFGHRIRIDIDCT
jgi:hypothetical protein